MLKLESRLEAIKELRERAYLYLSKTRFLEIEGNEVKNQKYRCVHVGKVNLVKGYIPHDSPDDEEVVWGEPKEISGKEVLRLISQYFERYPIVYVNAYAISRHCGGREEGGWWYNAGEPLASVPVLSKGTNIEDMEKHLTKLLGENYAHERSIYSVLGNGQNFAVYVEDHMAEYFPKERPHYE